MGRYLAANRIEFAVTYLCNSKCRHCQLGEEDERKRFANCIDKNMAIEIVRRIGKRFDPKSVMTFGGEPLLHPEIVYAIHKEAAKAGIPSREVITNGFWSKKIGEIQETANNLVKSGVNDVHISVDCFHQELIPLDIVKKVAESLLRAGMAQISWSPCWVISEDHNNSYNRKTKVILRKLKGLPIESSDGNVMQPKGRAIFWLRDYLPPKTKMPKGNCGDMPYTEHLDSVNTVFIEPDGRIAVCEEFYIGNAFETNILDIIENYNPFKMPEAKAIIEKGMEGLIDWARTKGVEPDAEGYYNICHMCTDIRRRVNRA